VVEVSDFDPVRLEVFACLCVVVASLLVQLLLLFSHKTSVFSLEGVRIRATVNEQGRLVRRLSSK